MANTDQHKKSVEKNKKPFVVRPSHLGACIQLAGSVNAGVLMYRVISRYRKKWVLRNASDNKEYVVLKRDQWQTDTGLTRHQYDAAIRALKSRGLVECQHKKVSTIQKHQRTWLRLEDHVFSAIADITKAETVSEISETTSPTISENAETINNTLSAKADDKKMKINPCGIENEEDSNDSSAQAGKSLDAQNQFEAGKKDKSGNDITVSPKASHGKLLATQWNQAMQLGGFAPDDFSGEKEQKWYGPLKCMEDYWNKVSADGGASTLRTVLGDWQAFYEYVENAKGKSFIAPHRPNPGWLNSVKESAVDWIKSRDPLIDLQGFNII